MCRGRGEVSQVTRSFLGQVMTSRPCPQCGGFGTVIRDPCPECSGDGRVRTRRTIKVRIPAGVEDGTHIQLAGEGEVGPGGGPPGDLFLEIVERPHQIFERHGDDLHCTVQIPMTAAALGTILHRGDARRRRGELDIRPGTQSGPESSRCTAGASSSCNETGRGDLLIHVDGRDADQARRGAGGAAARARQAPRRGAPARQVRAAGQQGFFSRLRDAFNGR